jgi:hypothetical protein
MPSPDGNGQAQVTLPFSEHEPFVNHHVQERPHLFLTKTRKAGQDTGYGTVLLTKKIDLSGGVFQTMGHIIGSMTSLSNDQEVSSILVREDRVASRLLMELSIGGLPRFQPLLHRTPEALLMPQTTMVALDKELQSPEYLRGEKLCITRMVVDPFQSVGFRILPYRTPVA